MATDPLYPTLGSTDYQIPIVTNPGVVGGNGFITPTEVAAGTAFRSLFLPGAKIDGTLGQTKITLGGPGNAIASDIVNATLSGGGQTGYENIIGGDGSTSVNTGTGNVVSAGTGAEYSTIHGGYDNVAGGLATNISGFHNYTGIGTSHGTISGGSLQKIRGSSLYGTIGGGTGHDVNAANYGVVGGGDRNTVSAATATIAGGQLNVNSGNAATVGGGQNHNCSGVAATIPGGRENTAVGASAIALGREAKAYSEGMLAHGSGKFATNGDAQYERVILRRVTTDATPLGLGLNGAASSQQLQIPSSVTFRMMLVARESATGDSKAWTIAGLATNNTAQSVTFVGGAPTPTVVAASAGAAAWTCSVSGGADSITVNVTGEVAKTINWVAAFELAEVVC